MTTFFTDTIITPAGAVQAFNWNFGTEQLLLICRTPHTYTVAGTFNVTLSIAVTSGCQNIISHPVTIQHVSPFLLLHLPFVSAPKKLLFSSPI
ncbi:MAG: hypothetical protein IPH45_21735 [Bacteroidales bacterium]|nr:hypothetical protein [Bacteroidales bacterium]